jgi:type IV pilus assembly protein PilV
MNTLAHGSEPAAMPAEPVRGALGFTIIEVLAALTIFAIGSAGLVAATVGAVRYNRASGAFSSATALAQDLVEQLRALDPSTNPAALTAGTHTDANNLMTALGVQSPAGVFTRQWTATRDAPIAGISTVMVSVSWTDGTTRTVRLWTYVCQITGCT